MKKIAIFPIKQHLLTFLFLCCSILLFAQQHQTFLENLKDEIAKARTESDMTHANSFSHQGLAYIDEHQIKDSSIIIFYNYLANNFIVSKQYDSAYHYFNKMSTVLHLLDKKQKATFSVLVYSKLGEISTKKGNYEAAEKFFTQAKSNTKNLSKEDADITVQVDMQSSLAQLYAIKGNIDAAEDVFWQNIKLTEDRYGLENENTALNYFTLASFYTKYNRDEEAVKIFTKIKPIVDKVLGKKHRAYAAILNNLALASSNLGRMGEAENYYRESLTLNKENFGNKSLNAIGPTTNLFLLLMKNGNKEAEAEQLVNDALGIFAALGKEKNIPLYVITIANIASFYQNKKNPDLDKALAYFLEAKKIHEVNLKKEHPSYTIVLQNLGALYFKLKQHQKAEELYNVALDFSALKWGLHHPNYVKALNSKGTMFSILNRHDEAIELFLDAINNNSVNGKLSPLFSDAFLKEIADYEFYSEDFHIKTLQSLAKVLYNKYPDSLAAEKEHAFLAKLPAIGIQLVNRYIKKLELASDKATAYEWATTFALNGMKSNYELFDKTKNTAFVDDCYYYSEANKSALLADALSNDRALAFGGIPDSLIKKGDEFRKKLAALKQKLDEEKSDSIKQILHASLNKTNFELNSYMAEVNKKFPNYYKLKFEEPKFNLKEIQQQLAENTVLIEYFIHNANSKMYVIIISKDKKDIVQIAQNPADLKKVVKDLRNSLTEYSEIKKSPIPFFEAYTTSAYQLYETILKPVVDKISPKTKKLIIVADDVLGHIPFEALLTEKVTSKEPNYKTLPYLLNKYSISYSYSAQLLSDNLSSSKKSNNGKLLAMAASYKEKADEQFLSRSKRSRSMRNALGDLPAAKQEVEGLSKMFAGNFTLGSATNEQFFKENAKDYAIIHLAMHGLLDAKKPLLSSLAFTENSDSTEDNFLEAWEISHLKLNAELVVLSACETGYGKFQQGEGVMSLARSFMYAGVPSLVVSLWQVNDASTSTIMQLFYKNLAKGMDKAAALRQAKIDYIEGVDGGGIAAHPAFWAPFILIGDERPVALATRGGWTWYLIGGLGLLAVVGGIFALRGRKEK